VRGPRLDALLRQMAAEFEADQPDVTPRDTSGVVRFRSAPRPAPVPGHGSAPLHGVSRASERAWTGGDRTHGPT
jgi:hypothetical protein